MSDIFGPQRFCILTENEKGTQLTNLSNFTLPKKQ